MILNSRIPLALAVLTFSSLSLPGKNAQAGDWIADHGSKIHNEIGSKVYALETLADQVAFRYGWELRFNRGCKDSLALLKHIRKHTALTNDLVRAYRGNCVETFSKAASDVRDSAICMQNIKKRARLSDAVSDMISQSHELSTFVQANSAYFQPVHQAPQTDRTFPRRHSLSGVYRP